MAFNTDACLLYNFFFYMVFELIYNCYKIIYRYINCIFINNVCGV